VAHYQNANGLSLKSFNESFNEIRVRAISFTFHFWTNTHFVPCVHFKNLLPHVNGCNVHDIQNKVVVYDIKKKT
jgi:hypothetical protein